jgi:hypothetical protein
MAESVTVVGSGGTPVTEHPDDRGVPMTSVASGARPVTIVASGAPPVTFISASGVLQPGGTP